MASGATDAQTAVAMRADAIRLKKMQKKAAKADSSNPLFLPSPNLMASALTHFSGGSSKGKSKSKGTPRPAGHSTTQPQMSSPALQKSFSMPAAHPGNAERHAALLRAASANLPQTRLSPFSPSPPPIDAALAALKAMPSFSSLLGSAPPLFGANRGGFAADPVANILSQLQTNARADQTTQLVAALLQTNKSVPGGGDMLDTVAQLLLQRYAAQQQQQQQQTLIQQLLNPTPPPLWQQPETFQIPEHDASLSGPSDSSESDGGCPPRGSSSDESGDECLPQCDAGVSNSDGFESCSLNTDGWGSELWPEDDMSALDQLLGSGMGSLPDANLDPMTWPDDGSPRNWVPTTPPTTKPALNRNSLADANSAVGSHCSLAHSVPPPSACSTSRPEMSSPLSPPRENASVDALISALVAGSSGLATTILPPQYPSTPVPASSFNPGSYVEAVASAATLSTPPPRSASPQSMEALVGLVESFVQQQNTPTLPSTGPLLSSLFVDEKPLPKTPPPKTPTKPAMVKANLALVKVDPAPSSGALSAMPSEASGLTEAGKPDEQALKRGPFSEEEDRRFLGKLAEYGRKITFKKMTQFFPGRSERQLRRRWVRLKRKHNIVTISGVQEVLDRLPPIPSEPGPITLEQLVDCFKLPMQDACQKLSAGRPQVLTTQRFRQLFQKYGIARWPYRQVMAGRPVPEILKAAEEERARRKHLESECSSARKALGSSFPNPSNPWNLPATPPDNDSEDGWGGAVSESDDESSDSDDDLLDAELDAPDRSVTPPPARNNSFGGFPALPQGSPLSRCSSVVASRKAGIAVPSYLNFSSPAKESFRGAEEKGSSKGGSGSQGKCPPVPEADVFSDMAAAMFLNDASDDVIPGDEPEWQCLSMLVDDEEGPSGMNGTDGTDGGDVGHKRTASEAADMALTSEEGAHKRARSC